MADLQLKFEGKTGAGGEGLSMGGGGGYLSTPCILTTSALCCEVIVQGTGSDKDALRETTHHKSWNNNVTRTFRIFFLAKLRKLNRNRAIYMM